MQGGFILLFLCVSHAKLILRHEAPNPLHLQEDVRRPFVMTASSKEDYAIRNLPGLPTSANLDMYSGYITVNNQTGGNLFFWLVQHPQPSTAPLMIWLNGGPGCSSMDGLFKENGPFFINPDLSLQLNPASWHYAASILYVDQPVGTGLSYVANPAGYARNQSQVNEMFHSFLQQWYQLFPEFQARPLYIFGESWGGHYVPAISHYILSQGILKVKFAGIGIGNGWSDPPVQYGAYAAFARGVGLIDEVQNTNLETLYQQCLPGMLNGVFSRDECEHLMDYITEASGNITTNTVNVYDIRLYSRDGGSDDWPAGLNLTGAYLKQPTVRRAIHTDLSPPYTPVNWIECNPVVGGYLGWENLVSMKPIVAELLDKYGLRVIFYNGQFDLICNHVGTDRFLNTMMWSGRDSYLQSPTFGWTPLGTIAGYAKSNGNLTFLRILGGSHMVPMDKPAECQAMVQAFIHNTPLNNYPQFFPTPSPSPSPAPAPTSSSTSLPVWVAIVSGVGGLMAGGLVVYMLLSSFVRAEKNNQNNNVQQAQYVSIR